MAQVDQEENQEPQDHRDQEEKQVHVGNLDRLVSQDHRENEAKEDLQDQ